jgi:hypothetical protein
MAIKGHLQSDSVAAIMDVLNQEIAWCQAHPNVQGTNPEFRAGFIKGIEQSKYLIQAMLKADKESK